MTSATIHGELRRSTAIVVAGSLLACGFIAYGNSLNNPFIIDDRIVIVGDPRVTQCDIPALLTEEYWPGERGNLVYRPATSVSFALNWAVSQKPWAFRLPNLLMHVAAAWALFLLAHRLTGSLAAAVAAAVLFTVHPVHTTPLNQIVDRADIGAAACVLSAAWLYLRSETTGRRIWQVTLAALLFGLGLYFKENAVTLIGVVVLLHLTHDRDALLFDWSIWRRRLFSCYLPMIAILTAYLVVRASVLDDVVRGAQQINALDNIVAQPAYGLDSGASVQLARWGTPVAIFGKAAWLLVWPAKLCWDYSYSTIPSIKSWGDSRLWLGAAVLVAMAFAMIVSWRRRGYVCFAAGFVLITYSVVSNTIVIVGSAFAERYLYLPSAGFCLLVGLAVCRDRQGPSRKDRPEVGPTRVAAGLRAGRRRSARAAHGAVITAVALVAFAFGVLTISRNDDFRSPERLNETDLQANPQSGRLWCSAAGDALNDGKLKLAIERVERAIEIYPESTVAWRVRGLAQQRLNEPEAALASLRRSFELGGSDSESANAAIAAILKSRGDYRAAIALLENFVASHPGSPTAHNNLAWYLITANPTDLRDPLKALEHAHRAVALEPTAGDFCDTYADVLAALGRRDEMKQMIREALARIPETDDYRGTLEQKLAAP